MLEAVDNRTERLADGVWRVEVAWCVNVYLLADDGRGDDGGLTLVDSGTKAAGPRLVRSIRLLGLDPRAVHRLLLTHWHADHAGSAAAFAASSAATQVRCGRDDLPVVARGEPPAARGASRAGRVVQRMFPRPRPVAASELSAGARLPVGGGVEVVAAPGHTAGHLAFWLPAHGVLLAGDAVLNLLRPSAGLRVMAAEPSAVPGTLARLAALRPQVVACGHGPPVTRDAPDVLARLAERRR